MAVARSDQLHVPAPDGASPINLIVTGPESSGTRFVSRWLEAHPDVAAHHWSMPSGLSWARHWPTDHDFGAERPTAVVLVIRSFEATVRSQLTHTERGFSGRDEVEALTVQALLRALNWAVSHGVAVYPLLYDTVVDHPETMADVFRWLAVEPVDCPEDIVDGNDKWRAPEEPEPQPELEPEPEPELELEPDWAEVEDAL